MTSRHRLLKALNHEEADRVPITDAFWPTTEARWHKEGLPADQSAARYFGFELSGVGFEDTLFGREETLEETEGYRLFRTGDGNTRKEWKDATATPQCLDFLVRGPDDWERLKGRLSNAQQRIDWQQAKASAARAHDEGLFFCFSTEVGYDRCQRLVGTETLLAAMALEPDWVSGMFSSSVDLAIEAAEAMQAQGLRFDGAFLNDDMGYRNSSLFSPAMYRRLLFPQHQRIFGYFHDRGAKVLLHSCGCVKQLIPDLLEAGLDCLQPLEVKAGMDLVELKRQYAGRLALMGGIDVRKMAAEDPAGIEHEIATKIPVAMAGGGYIYHSDHSVPDDVSFAQYCRTMELVRHYGRFR